MAWIESHTSLDKHHKVIRLRLAMRWSKNETIGFLHRFWWTVLEVSPSGDITALSSPEVMAEMLDMPIEAVSKALKVMEDPDPKLSFLERKNGRLLVHDWLDYAGRYLSESRFKRNPEKMDEIRHVHGQSTDSPRIVHDTNQPTKPKNKKVADQLNDVGPEYRMPPADPPNIKATRDTLKRFVKPTVEEIAAYCAERQNGINPKRFFDSNEAKGWVVGKNQTPMKDWKATIRTWEENRKDERGSSPRHDGGTLQPDFIFPGGAP